jgi:hypothetical protein
VVTDKAKRASISISLSTKSCLDSVKHPGQSYDGLIQELINVWEEKKRDTKIEK